MTAVDGVVVAIPARDEEACLPAALAAVRLAAERCPVPVVVAVAADACTDGTEGVARDLADVVVRTDRGCVGAARAAAVEAGLAAIALDPARVWVASTDADSAAPSGWLAVHLAFADAGVQLLRGSVRPDPGCPPDLLRRWRHAHPPREHHDHVHGANLGVRADAYRAAGGFADLVVDEDRALVAAVLAAGRPAASTDRAPVVTSARTAGRVRDGFAGYLRALDALTEPV